MKKKRVFTNPAIGTGIVHNYIGGIKRKVIILMTAVLKLAQM